ncbi:MAG: kelch repeat-containing protein [Gemmatimonadota bacterium]
MRALIPPLNRVWARRLSPVVLGIVIGCAEDGPIESQPPTEDPPPPSFDIPGTWSRGPSLPEPLLAAGAARLGDEAWVIGGIADDQTTSDRTYRLDLRSGSWSKGPDLPRRLNHVGVARLGDSIFVAGGARTTVPTVDEGATYSPAATLWHIDATASEWSAREPLPEPRAAGGLAAVDGALYLVGGYSSGLLSPDDWFRWDEILAPATLRWTPDQQWEVLPDVPTLRDHLVVVERDDRLHAIAGRRLMIFETTGRHGVFDPATNTWQEEAAGLPAGRGGAAAVNLDGSLHVMGGEPMSRGRRHDVYDAAQNRWLTAPPLPEPVHGASAVVYDGKIYVFGGANVESWTEISRTTWVFTPDGAGGG